MLGFGLFSNRINQIVFFLLEEDEDSGQWPVFHNRTRGVMVFIEHRSFIAEQVLVKQLWIQVSDLPHHVSHDGLFSSQLRCYCLDEDGSDANDPISSSVS